MVLDGQLRIELVNLHVVPRLSVAQGIARDHVFVVADTDRRIVSRSGPVVEPRSKLAGPKGFDSVEERVDGGHGIDTEQACGAGTDDTAERTNDLGPAGGNDHEGVQDPHHHQGESGFAVADANHLVDFVHRIVQRLVLLPCVEWTSAVLQVLPGVVPGNLRLERGSRHRRVVKRRLEDRLGVGSTKVHLPRYRRNGESPLPVDGTFVVLLQYSFLQGINAGVDNSEILSIFLRGALGSRGRKRARRAANFLGGKKGFLTASTLLGAAGVAWGIYDSLKPGAAGAMGAVGVASAVPPPIPGTVVTTPVPAEDRGLPLEVLRVVRLAVSAARADGALLPAERALILSHARETGVETAVEDELATSRPLAEIVRGVTDDQKRRDLYVLAYTIIRADENVTGAERVYLAQLAHQLGLDAATTAQLEQDTASKIDATPDTQP